MNEVLRQAIKNIGSRDLNIRKPAMDRVSEAGNEVMLSLLENLKSADGYLRAVTIAVIWDIQRREGIQYPHIIEALRDYVHFEDDIVNQADAIGIITDLYWQTKDECAANTLIDLLSTSENEHVREHAATSLGEIRSKNAVVPLIEMLKDENYWLSREAILALGLIGDEHAIEPLIDCLNDTRADLQKQTNASVAAKALREIGTPKGLAAIEKWEKTL